MSLESAYLGRIGANFPGHYEGNDKMVHGTFGANLARLVAVKQRYYPTKPLPFKPQHPAGLTA
jgi:hypothetical protein